MRASQQPGLSAVWGDESGVLTPHFITAMAETSPRAKFQLLGAAWLLIPIKKINKFVNNR
jgi:hypothetical protein